jgi:hypothetical protein
LGRKKKQTNPRFEEQDMKNVILSIAAVATLFAASLATPGTAEARPWRGGYYAGPAYYGGYYRPFYRGYYRPYGGYYRPYYGNYYYGAPYRTYYRGYGYPRYYGPGSYFGPGVRIGAGPVGVRVY